MAGDAHGRAENPRAGAAEGAPAPGRAVVITLADVTLRVRDRHVLTGVSWEIRRGENWAVLGPNGSGKSTLVKALIGEAAVVAGRMIRHLPAWGRDRIGYVSFELHEGIIHREEGRDEARHFSGDLDGEQSVAHLLQWGAPCVTPPSPALERVADAMAIGHLLERGVRRLSTGEMRRVLIARALLRSPWLLILDEPFGGLDPASRQDLHATVGRLVKGGTQVILVTHHADEIFEACSHVICLKEGRVLARGRREDLLTPERMRALYARRAGRRAARPAPEPPSTPAGAPRTPILVEMKNVTVAYGTRIVLDRVDWTVRRGENWAVQGPNGSGKSTLLRLITGDHPQAYANDIRLFGRPRGSGETVWEIKGRIGMVSPEFQIRFHRRMTVMDMVLSGFFDSVGLYRRASAQQRAAARRWVEHLGLAGLAGAAADRISYGERRMALIARAMVKSPEILVLDEPCQGLDRGNREMVIDMVNQVGTRTATCLVYVTHRPEEIPACIAHVLVLGAWEPPVVGESPATPSRSRPIPGSPSITENAG